MVQDVYMKWSIDQIVGKTISNVVVVDKHRDPKQQLFLVFDDHTSLEIYGEYFDCARELEAADCSRFWNSSVEWDLKR